MHTTQEFQLHSPQYTGSFQTDFDKDRLLDAVSKTSAWDAAHEWEYDTQPAITQNAAVIITITGRDREPIDYVQLRVALPSSGPYPRVEVCIAPDP